jgi:hypothetical protein
VGVAEEERSSVVAVSLARLVGVLELTLLPACTTGYVAFVYSESIHSNFYVCR